MSVRLSEPPVRTVASTIPDATGIDGCDTDRGAVRHRRVLIAASLLVALGAGVALAFFLATEAFRQSVVSQPLIVEADGLEDIFGDDPRVQPWNLSEADEGRVIINSGEFTLRNPNSFTVAYALGSQFDDEIEMVRTGGEELPGDSTGQREQFAALEVRACTRDGDGGSSLLAPLLGGDEPTDSCTAFIRLSEIEQDASARPLDVATLAPGEEARVRLDLRLRDTRILQRDDLRTLYDLVVVAEGR